MKTKLFISYAHKDSRQVQPVAQELSKLGFDVWIDSQDLQGGQLWSEGITRGIRECHYYILFISKASMKSDDVRREVDLAYSSKRKMILVRLDSAEIPVEMVYQTSGVQWLDIKNPDWILRLLVALGSKASPSAEFSMESKQPKPRSKPRPKPRDKKEAGTSIQIQGNTTGSVIIVGDKNSVNQGKNN
jgi:hypothetical protein